MIIYYGFAIPSNSKKIINDLKYIESTLYYLLI